MNPPVPTASPRLYLVIWAILLVLLFITWGVAQFDLGPLNVPLAMTIAVIKMTLVILYFMHVRYSSQLTWLFVASGFLWLLILLALTMSDYLTRG